MSKLRTYHGLCGSNELLYMRRVLSMGRQKVRPFTVPHFQPMFLKLKTKKHILGIVPACRIWLTSGHGKGVCEDSEFLRTFGCFLFCL